MAIITNSGKETMAKIFEECEVVATTSNVKISNIERVCVFEPRIYVWGFPPFYVLDITIFDPPV